MERYYAESEQKSESEPEPADQKSAGTEFTYSGTPKKAPTWSIISRLEKSVVREYKGHYQVQVRVDKPANGSLLANEIFDAAVDVLSQMLMLKRKKSKKA